MIVDQDEIDALLDRADNLVEEAREESPKTAPAAPAGRPTRSPLRNVPPEVARILKIRVPVIVQLASRRLSVSAARRLSLGMIIEFHKSADEPLELLINNHPVGKGDAVKVGEHFGLRVTQIRDAATRIRSMAG